MVIPSFVPLCFAAVAFGGDDPVYGPSPALGGGVDWCWETEADDLDKAHERPRLVYLWAPGSAHCANTWTSAWTSPDVHRESEAFSCVAFDVSTERGADLVRRFGVRLLPTTLVLTRQGVVDDALIGAITGSTLVRELQRILRGSETITAMRRRVEQQPNDTDALLDLAQKLRHVGDEAGYEALVGDIRRADPKGRTLVGSQLLLRETIDTTLASPNANDGCVDTKRLRRFLLRTPHREVRHEGWNWIAQRKRAEGDLDTARDSRMEAWNHLDPSANTDWYANVLREFFEDRDALDAKQRRFTLDVARRCEQGARDVLARAPAGPDGIPLNTQRLVAGKLSAAACGWSMQGKRDRAIALMDESLALDPENKELQELRNTLLATRGR